MPEDQRLRYLEDDADRFDRRHDRSDQKFERLAEQTDRAIDALKSSNAEQIEALKDGQLTNQRILISILVALVVASLMLAANVAIA
jgi:hypothetical protein